MSLKWMRCARCDFLTEKAQVLAGWPPSRGLNIRLTNGAADAAELGLDISDEHGAKICIGENWADLDPLSHVKFIRGRGDYDHYEYNSPDIDDDKARRISLDFANIELSRRGIEEFVRYWGMPTYGLATERQFHDMRHQIRCILLSAKDPQCQEWIFRLHRGHYYQPSDLFECAIRELEALARQGVLRYVRECPECKHYYVANKRTANRKGRGPGAPQQFCRGCGPKARPKARRQRLKLEGARGHTGKKVTADPKYAKPSMRNARQQ